MSIYAEFERKIRSSDFATLDLNAVWIEFELATKYFENADFRFRLKNAKRYAFALETIAMYSEVTYEKLELFLKYLDKVKDLFFDKFLWNLQLTFTLG